MLIFKLERRQSVQNVGNWTGYLNVILIRKIFSIISVVVIMLRVIIILEIFDKYAISNCPFITCQNFVERFNGVSVCYLPKFNFGMYVRLTVCLFACLFVTRYLTSGLTYHHQHWLTYVSGQQAKGHITRS